MVAGNIVLVLLMILVAAFCIAGKKLLAIIAAGATIVLSMILFGISMKNGVEFTMANSYLYPIIMVVTFLFSTIEWAGVLREAVGRSNCFNDYFSFFICFHLKNIDKAKFIWYNKYGDFCNWASSNNFYWCKKSTHTSCTKDKSPSTIRDSCWCDLNIGRAAEMLLLSFI